MCIRDSAQGLGHLVLAQVGQDVGDGELGLALFLADTHGDFLAIFADDLAVEGQGDGGPPVSYTHLDVYKRQAHGSRRAR